jgi:hypothetical protein
MANEQRPRIVGLDEVTVDSIIRLANGRVALVTATPLQASMYRLTYANGETEEGISGRERVTLVYTPMEAGHELLKQFSINDGWIAKKIADDTARETRHNSYIDKHKGITLEEWIRTVNNEETRGLEQRTYYEIAKALPDFEEAGVNNPDLLINQAWSRGHSNGLHDVLIELDELLDLFRGQ